MGIEPSALDVPSMGVTSFLSWQEPYGIQLYYEASYIPCIKFVSKVLFGKKKSSTWLQNYVNRNNNWKRIYFINTIKIDRTNLITLADRNRNNETQSRKHKRGKRKKNISKRAKQSEIRKRLKRHFDNFFCEAWEQHFLTYALWPLVILITLATNKAAAVSIKLPMRCRKNSTKKTNYFNVPDMYLLPVD